MDVVVRTPHGDADVEIVAAPSTCTIGELLQAITGQAAPATARIDQHTVSTSRPIREVGLSIGSLIDTRAQAPIVDSDDVGATAALLQLTGRGAGTITEFAPGTYRIGTARRLHAPEMERAPVETAAFDLQVGESGDVTVQPGPADSDDLGPYAPTVAGESFDRPTQWTQGNLAIGGRLFAIEPQPGPRPARQLAEPAADGSIPFHRSPVPPPQERLLAVGAVRAAAAADASLWRTRRTDDNAFEVPFGMHPDGVTVTSVDFKHHLGVALVGSERFNAAAARAMLIEAATSHGPTDLGIVIASTPEHLTSWTWARWLPHLRRGGPGSAPDLLFDTAALATWADSISHARSGEGPTSSPARDVGSGSAGWNPPTSSSAQPRITLLVLDDVSLWSRRDSPLRRLVTNPPPELRVMALCAGLHEAPGMCTSLIEEVAPATHLAHLVGRTADHRERPALYGPLANQHLRLGSAPQIISDIRPALMEPSLAADVARLLAPLDDIESQQVFTPPTRVAAPSLAELVTLSESGPSHPGTLSVALGVSSSTGGTVSPSDRTPVFVDVIDDRPVILAASDPAQYDLAVAAMMLGAAVQRKRGELAILIVGHDRTSWCADLPHLAGWISHQDASDPARLIHRVAHVLTEQPHLEVLVVIEHAFTEPQSEHPTPLVTGMVELAESLSNVGLVLTTNNGRLVPDALGATAGTYVWLGIDGDGDITSDGISSPIAGVRTDDAAEDAAPSAPSSFDPAQLVIRPAAYGRALTTLERRLSRSTADDSHADNHGAATTATIARQISVRANSERDGRGGQRDDAGSILTTLLPPPMPTTVDFTSLLDKYVGDGIPIGLVDRPERATSDVYWWQPGQHGSLVALGSPRSGMTALLDLLITGIAARFSADDLHVSAIEALPQRRRALVSLPHSGDVVLPDDFDGVTSLITGLRTEMSNRLDKRGDWADLLLLIGDVGRLRRSLATDAADTVFGQLADLARSGPAVGINVVVIGGHAADLGGLVRIDGDTLVGAVSDPVDRIRLGAPAFGPADRHVGRCWSTDADRRVQLAVAPQSSEHEVAILAPVAAAVRPPHLYVSGGQS